MSLGLVFYSCQSAGLPPVAGRWRAGCIRLGSFAALIVKAESTPHDCAVALACMRSVIVVLACARCGQLPNRGGPGRGWAQRPAPVPSLCSPLCASNRYTMGVSGWPAETAGKYSVRRSGKLYKKRLKELRTFSRSCAATPLAEFSSACRHAGLRPNR